MLKRNQRGFTLIELLLVVVIIGVMLAVIVPRAWRANVDAKYGLVRQNASELASFASQWIEQQLEAQDSTSTASTYTYLRSLTWTGATAVNTLPGTGDNSGRWIANNATSNWVGTGAGGAAITGRSMGGVADSVPENTVQAIVPPEREPRNPFNGASVFVTANNPTTTPIPGAIAAGGAADATAGGNWVYFAFVFQGTDSTTTAFNTAATTFHAGQTSNTLPGLRNGVFFARSSF